MAQALAPIRWPAEAIWQAVEPALHGFTVEILPAIGSTNTELLRRFRLAAATGATPEPTLLVAEAQTAGRGRLGRTWESQRGASLTFSLGLPLQPADWSGLSLIVGISLAESLSALVGGAAQLAAVESNNNQPDRAGSSPARPAWIGLKWPNDLWLCDGSGERKLGGILVETASWDGLRYAVVGVGLNIAPITLPPTANATTDAGEATEAAAPRSYVAPGWLQQLRSDVDAPAALGCVVAPLVQALQGFAQFGFAPFQARFAQRDVLQGRAVALSNGLHGTAHGVGESGALRVQTSAGMQEITTSEISVRPLQPQSLQTLQAWSGAPLDPPITITRAPLC